MWLNSRQPFNISGEDCFSSEKMGEKMGVVLLEFGQTIALQGYIEQLKDLFESGKYWFRCMANATWKWVEKFFHVQHFLLPETIACFHSLPLSALHPLAC